MGRIMRIRWGMDDEVTGRGGLGGGIGRGAVGGEGEYDNKGAPHGR